MKNSLNYKDIILKHKQSIVSSRSECDISTTIAGKKVNAPVICANMPSVLTYDNVKEFDKAGWFHIWNRDHFENRYDFNIFRYIEKANEDNLNFVSVSLGANKDLMDKVTLTQIKDKKLRVDSICIDVALIYNSTFECYLKWLRQEFPDTYLIAGNCNSFDAVLWLQKLEFNCAKVNIGVSNACRTKQYTGFGSSTVTDLNEIDEYFRIRKNRKIQIIADGGLTQENGEVWIGDIAKAIRFGADFVMSGSLFANCLGSPALHKGYAGNSTSSIKGHSDHIEGTTIPLITTNGLTIAEMIKRIEQSLRSSVSYAGGNTLEALKEVDYQII